MRDYDFHFYALRHDPNKDKIYFFNIFDNRLVYESTVELCDDYWKGKYTYDEFVIELNRIIMWQERSRIEYEIDVGQHFIGDIDELTRIDCYDQAHANIDLIATQVINEYKRKHPREKQITKG